MTEEAVPNGMGLKKWIFETTQILQNLNMTVAQVSGRNVAEEF
jgi:hypothetical protein